MKGFLGHWFAVGLTSMVLAIALPAAVPPAAAAVPVEHRSSSGVAPRPRLEPVPPSTETESPPRDWSSPPDTARSTGDTAGSGTGLGQLFTELQTLRNEVQELRSLVEEQQHKLRQLESAQQEQYQNLDGRILGLSGQGAGNGAATSNGAGAEADRPINANTRPVPPANGAGAPRNAAGEKAAYQTAFESMKARAFDRSIEQFTQLIRDYPNGEMTPGSWYWLGELYLAKADLSQSRESFSQVVNLYPSHNKAPDALYKMGVVFHRLGDNAKALEYLDRVQRDFPASAAAGLAKTYASELR
jgi:tol-pal system protein YbgF